MPDVDSHELVGVAGLLDGEPVVFDSVVFEMRYETIRSDLPELDPNWKYVDKQSHGHFVVNERDLPTLEWVVTNTWWCEEHHEEHDEGEYRCRVCAEPIEPGTRPFTPRRMHTGSTLRIRMDLPQPLPAADEHIVQIGRDTYLCRQAAYAYDGRGGSVTLTGVPKPVEVAGR